MPATVLLATTSWWPSSAHLAISLASAGIRVAAVYPRHGHPLAKTSSVAVRFPYQATSPMEALAAAIHGSGADFILPCDDRAVSHLHRLHAKALSEGLAGKPVADLIKRSLGSPAGYKVVSSRGALLRNASSENIPVPQLAELTTIDQLHRWGESQAFPWVMKVDGSWGGLGVKVVHSLQEAEACFHRMRQPLRTLPMLKRLVANRDPFWIEAWRSGEIPGITVQSFIEGRPANCAVFCKEGKVLAGIAVEVVAAQALIGPATIVRVVEGRQMLHAAEALAKRLNLSGFHGFDFILEQNTGTAYLIELNPRCAMPCHLRLGGRRDLVGCLYEELSDQPSGYVPAVPGSDIVAYFPQAWLSDPTSEALRFGFHDVPWSEPDLFKELMLLPWPDRSFLARFSDQARKLSFEQRSARRFLFQPLQAIDPVSEGRGLTDGHREVV